jgi:hypothetical protein
MQPNFTIRFYGILFFLASLHIAIAQPTVSSVPVNGATGVSPSAAVVFTFSAAMDTTLTTATFFDLTASSLAPVNSVWSAGNTVLTCTPSPAFGNNHNIQWFVSGEDTVGNQLNGGAPSFGSFTTGSGSGGGGGGSGTNAVTTFVVGKAWEYDQTSTATPTLNTNIPYAFAGTTSLASNRTATSITLTLPTAAISNLVQNFVQHEDYFVSSYNTNLTTFNSTFPAGNYIFNVFSNAANQPVTVNLPNYAQPNAPHVSNYAAAQAINPSQPFILTWDAFTGGGSTDFVFVVIGNVFQSPGVGQTNALSGTATSVTIPAATLQAGSNYDATIGFYHGVVTTNSGGGYITEAYVATLTQFSISTAGSVVAALVFTNVAWSGGTFGFNILTAPSQTLTVVYNTNLNSASSTWPILLSTNSSSSIVHISDPHAATNKTMFYRARYGN